MFTLNLKWRGLVNVSCGGETAPKAERSIKRDQSLYIGLTVTDQQVYMLVVVGANYGIKMENMTMENVQKTPQNAERVTHTLGRQWVSGQLTADGRLGKK